MPRRYCDSAYDGERPVSPLGEHQGRSGNSSRRAHRAVRPTDALAMKYWDLQQRMSVQYVPLLESLEALCSRVIGDLGEQPQPNPGFEKIQAMRIRQLRPLILRLRMERNDPAQSICLEDYEWLKRMSRILSPLVAEMEQAVLALDSQ